MTKEAALYSFWSSFDLPAYEENSVYVLAFPYIAYEIETGSFCDGKIPLTASLYYRSTNWTAAHRKKQEIAEKISYGGITLPYDNGAMRITRGSKFSSDTGDPVDDMIKRVILNINVEFLSED